MTNHKLQKENNMEHEGYSDRHNEELEKAITYLRERKIYVLENNFRPTSAVLTDVQQTMNRFRQQTQGAKLIKEVRRKQ